MVRKIGDILEYMGAVIFISASVWYLGFFTPNEQVAVEFSVTRGHYVFKNWSHKTPLSDILCHKPADSRIMFEDMNRFRSSRKDNADGYGSGSEAAREWTATGIIPPGIAEGKVKVWKEIYYPCFLGLPKVVRTDIVEFEHDIQN